MQQALDVAAESCQTVTSMSTTLTTTRVLCKTSAWWQAMHTRQQVAYALLARCRYESGDDSAVESAGEDDDGLIQIENTFYEADGEAGSTGAVGGVVPHGPFPSACVQRRGRQAMPRKPFKSTRGSLTWRRRTRRRATLRPASESLASWTASWRFVTVWS